MATDVDICNLALGMIGDAAAVQSINPPDQSAQASHCARFYPVARDAMLEMHQWGFATTRVTLAAGGTPPNQWQYSYYPPSNVLNYIAVLDPNGSDDVGYPVPLSYSSPLVTPQGPNAPAPYPFIVESDPLTGADILYCNVQNAVLRYTQAVTNPTAFSPLFVEGLALLLSSHLAGPVIKGAEGRAAAATQLQAFEKWFARATESDANQRRVLASPGAAWMVNR